MENNVAPSPSAASASTINSSTRVATTTQHHHGMEIQNNNDFTSYTHEKLLHDAVRYEDNKNEFHKFLERSALIEEGMLRRTIYVTGVNNVESNKENINHLKRFFESHYGSVQYIASTKDRNIDSYTRTLYGGRYNSGRGRGKGKDNMDILVDRCDVTSGKNKDRNKDAPAVRIRFEKMDTYNAVMDAVKHLDGYLHCPRLGYLSVPSGNNRDGNMHRKNSNGHRGPVDDSNVRNGHRGNHNNNNRTNNFNNINHNNNQRNSRHNNNTHQNNRAFDDYDMQETNGERQGHYNNKPFNPVTADKRKCTIHIEKCKRYDKIMEDLIDSSILQLNADGMSLGHWTLEDMYTDYIKESEENIRSDILSGNRSNNNIRQRIPRSRKEIIESFKSRNNDNYIMQSQWIHGYKLNNPNNDLNIHIDLTKRIFEISVSRLLNADLQYDFSASRDFMTFRFKDIDGYIELCYEPSNNDDVCYSLIFNLKYPPKLVSNKPTFGLGFAFSNDQYDELNENKRDLIFGGIPSCMIGNWYGYKINISKLNVEQLLHNKGILKLKSFGIVRMTLLNVQDAKFIGDTSIILPEKLSLSSSLFNIMITDENNYYSSTSNQYENDCSLFQNEIKKLHQYDVCLGFTLRSLLDQGRFCWYHAHIDFVNEETIDGHKLKRNIFALLRKYPKHVSQETLNEMSKACGRTKFPCQLFHLLVDVNVLEPTLQDHVLRIPRIALTPCRQLSMCYEVETSNRVVRKFVEEEGFDSESFVRVQICDENSAKLFFGDLTDVVVDRIKSALNGGIIVNGTSYEFLAFSSSQLKECSLWMVLPKKGWTAEGMRNSMGNFEGCNTPSKYAARIGQCFSTTFQGLAGQDMMKNELHNSTQRDSNPSMLRHVVVDDIGFDEKNIHSDGCGIISTKAMKAMLETIPHFTEERQENTSIIQIRFGGAKGVLVAWDDTVMKNVTKEKTVCVIALRKSMIKFNAKFHFLECCRAGSKVPYYLNRNVILLLGTRGVADEVFLTMQGDMLSELDKMLDDHQTALKLIASLGGPDQSQRTRLLNVMHCGLSPKTDPFLFSCCLAIRSHHIFALRKKARIFVENGAVLMGGIDESKLLPEFCVFLQIRKKPIANYDFEDADGFEPIVGPVLVTKHPVMHPGDVRMLLAVDFPELRGHKNVLLFSQHGKRPEPNKMAGSDLDGDEYAITWDNRLFLGEWNHCTHSDGSFWSHKGRKLRVDQIRKSARMLQEVNFQPLDYLTLATPTRNIRIETKTLVEHLINFAKNDNLGQIGMLWQDWAARLGANCIQCIELAKQHSIAVDFAKTGIPAHIPGVAKWSGPRAHWREKKDEKSYHCNQIIGQLYDEVLLKTDGKILDGYKDAMAGRFLDKYGQVLSLKGHNAERELRNMYREDIPMKLCWKKLDSIVRANMEVFANRQRLNYEKDSITIMNKYNMRNEGELFTSCIRKYHRLNKKRQHEVSEDVRMHCREICMIYRKNFFREILRIARLYYAVKVFGNIFRFPTSKAANRPSLESHAIRIADNDDENEAILQIIKWATDKNFSDCAPSDSFSIRRTARQLAAAYYVATYSPDRQFHGSFALFSFPWLVADVIACGLHDDFAHIDD